MKIKDKMPNYNRKLVGELYNLGFEAKKRSVFGRNILRDQKKYAQFQPS